MSTVTEEHPDRCENGHQLGPGRMLVGWLPCGCTERRGHRTVTCRECGAVWHDPPHHDDTEPWPTP